MDQNSQTYRLRMQGLENTLAAHQDRFKRFDARNDSHSAQIRTLERQLYDLKFDNSRLNEQVATLRPTDYQPETNRSGQHTDRYNRDYDRNRDATENPDSKPNDSHYYKNNIEIRHLYEGRVERSGRSAKTQKNLSRVEDYPSFLYQRYGRTYFFRNNDSVVFNIYMMFEDITDGTPVYMLIRTRRSNFDDLKKTFQRHFGTLAQSRGHLKGFAYSDTIKVDNGYSNWYLSKFLTDGEYGCDNAMAMLTFQTALEAKNWIDYHPDFKKSQFPEPDGAELLLLPEYTSVGDAPFTIVMMEYSNVVDPEYFKSNVIEPMYDILKEDYKSKFCVPFITYVVRTGSKHTIRGWWLGRNKTIVAHSFYNEQEAIRFCNDPKIEGLRKKAASVISGYETRVRFTVEPLRPERRK